MCVEHISPLRVPRFGSLFLSSLMPLPLTTPNRHAAAALTAIILASTDYDPYQQLCWCLSAVLCGLVLLVGVVRHEPSQALV